MGLNTEFKVRLRLKKDTPARVINLLKAILIDCGPKHNSAMVNPDSEHALFKTNRWYLLFLSSCETKTKHPRFYLDAQGYWVLRLYTNFKNYNEINQFFSWIKDYVTVGKKLDKYIGFKKHEEDSQRTYIWLEAKTAGVYMATLDQLNLYLGTRQTSPMARFDREEIAKLWVKIYQIPA